MSEADSKLTTEEPIAGQVAHGLFELETPLLRVRSLAYAAHMAASSVGDPGWDGQRP
jgi:hypothetical protein